MDLQTTLAHLRREDDVVAVIFNKTPRDGTLLQRHRGMWTLVMLGLIPVTTHNIPAACPKYRYPGRFYRF